MKPEAVRTIEDEHLAISTVLYALRHLAREMRAGAAADFTLLHAILDYIVSYPQRWHHPKEDKYLFTAIRRRTREADALIEKLEREHALGHPMVERLKKHLVAFRAGDVAAGDAFIATAERYVEFEWAHLRTEEDLLIPIAERVLTEADWEAIDQAFRENDNPLFGIKPRDEADTLYHRILTLAPAPIGFGGDSGP